MLDKLKDLWTRWNVQFKVVGGVLVVATVWGTCSYEPNLGQAVEEVQEDAAEEQGADPVSNTEEGSTENAVNANETEDAETTSQTENQ